MRSIICISAVLALAPMAQAQDIRLDGAFPVHAPSGMRAGPPLGCFQRIWTDEELARSPGQVLRGIRAHVIHDAARGGIHIRAGVQAADQGHARELGQGWQYFHDEFSCGPGYRAEFPFCYAYCDGGRMVFPRMERDTFVFEIGRMKLRGDDLQCQTAFDMGGNREGRFAYRVDRVADALCDEM